MLREGSSSPVSMVEEELANIQPEARAMLLERILKETSGNPRGEVLRVWLKDPSARELATLITLSCKGLGPSILLLDKDALFGQLTFEGLRTEAIKYIKAGEAIDAVGSDVIEFYCGASRNILYESLRRLRNRKEELVKKEEELSRLRGEVGSLGVALEGARRELESLRASPPAPTAGHPSPPENAMEVEAVEAANAPPSHERSVAMGASSSVDEATLSAVEALIDRKMEARCGTLAERLGVAVTPTTSGRVAPPPPSGNVGAGELTATQKRRARRRRAGRGAGVGGAVSAPPVPASPPTGVRGRVAARGAQAIARPPVTVAVTVTVAPGGTRTYAEVMASVRERVSLDELRIPPVQVKRASNPGNPRRIEESARGPPRS